MLKYKIILAGAKNVGKSSLISRFCDDIFNEDMQATIGVSFKKKTVALREDIGMEFSIWDFGGEKKYRTLFNSYSHGAAAAMILYDTTNKESLKDVQNWVELIDESTDELIVKVLIGTKVDLIDQRQVSLEDVNKSCGQYTWCGATIETSSKTGNRVEDAFKNVAERIMEKRLQVCKECDYIFSKKLKFCNQCGESAVKVTFS